ncbi:MAG TPA: hypothetical protein VFM62_02530 [Arthrobacter sp.]|nr:hypothetical protein [Arthrobacter sp.]
MEQITFSHTQEQQPRGTAAAPEQRSPRSNRTRADVLSRNQKPDAVFDELHVDANT